ncbi:acyl-CoA carboxylase subunit beta [Kordiimonas lacus]|uniref:Geranyl-CoA carboxylase beta subunit n=1 Tax=Kordiimonas lacus TaxID=637679 RepID=A0A1G7BG00_9PROT|nr:acyl-CoA carboxylase subunit beta [Kordiimonas lacus]SDE25903.1 geranyl-CoA carboxylase beta subunit [Kordiimonas lacus]
MPALTSQIDPASDSFKANASAMQSALDEITAIEGLKAAAQEKARALFEKRGKLLPKERLALLLDPGAPFLELSALAGYKMYDDRDGSGAGGSIAGIGYVSGKRCMVIVSNSAVKGGTVTPAGLNKSLRLQNIAMENKLPIVGLMEGGGANLQHVSDMFVEGARSFANQARLSAAGIPQITVVHGSSTAGGAYQPGLSDYVVMVRGRSKVFLAGPPLLKAATGEIAVDEELGGAELHAQVMGTAEYLAEDDADGIRYAREIMQRLPWKEPDTRQDDYPAPLYPADDLIGVVPADAKTPYDVREVIARLADGSDFLDFKNEYDSQTVCGHASVAGQTIGIIGNNGPITPIGATKAAQFVQLCDQAGIPILFLHNTTGFMVGKDAEAGGVVKHGSKLIQAVTNARVPRISVHIGGSYGAGNYAMCGRGVDPRFVFSWPNARTAVMGGAQAGMVLRIVGTEKAKRMGETPDEDMLAAMEKATADQMDACSTALYGTARLWDDGIIDPRDTRNLLIYLLDICRDADSRETRQNTFGVARF